MIFKTVDFHGNIYYRNFMGELHREDGPALIYKNGFKEWYKNGKIHRIGGPAVEWSSGAKEWRIEGILHREDGPAVTYNTEDIPNRYYYHGHLVQCHSTEEFLRIINLLSFI